MSFRFSYIPLDAAKLSFVERILLKVRFHHRIFATDSLTHSL
jgi:hypothetical protein